MNSFIKFIYRYAIINIAASVFLALAFLLLSKFARHSFIYRFVGNVSFLPIFLSPINILLMIACVFESLFNKEYRDLLLRNCLLLVAATLVPLIILYLFLITAEYRG